GGSFDWNQRVADLPSAGAVCISAVAQSLEHCAVHDARVGGPQSSRRWINDSRIFVRPQPPIPAVGAVRPRWWDLPIEADPPGDFSRDGPGDVAVGVRADEILGRDSRPLRYLHRLIHVLGALQPSQAGIDRLRIVRRPTQRPDTAAVVAVDHRTPNGRHHLPRLTTLP